MIDVKLHFLCSVLVIHMAALPVLNAREGYWQQRIHCEMDIRFDVKNHRYTGTQRLVYQNNSPDTLDRIYYHLYFNAFQPGSEMISWTERLPDPDIRILSRFKTLTADEVGYLRVHSLAQEGAPVPYRESRTILEVTLARPVPPGQSTVLDMTFDAQVPVQIRRSGRFNAEGIHYSMAQWFPKVCNYDNRGWHAHPYVQREFYGVWGDYDVRITIDKRYILGATGYLQNPQEVGAGYEDPSLPVVASEGPLKTWHFFAPNVHDFVWTADPRYTHTRRIMHDGTEFHFLYVATRENREAWEALPALMDSALFHINRRFGSYPYRQYSILQGGDGGMEYPMATLITGNRPLHSLVGVSVHELLHMWYQMTLGFNESYYAWMDEGFTSYAANEIMAELFPLEDALAVQRSSYYGYFGLVRSGMEEPLSTHADHYLSNFAYGAGVYNKGAVFLHQLGYIMGAEALEETLLAFYHEWKFKHPTDLDFIRTAEKISGLELDWYLDYWVYSTKTIDYTIDSVWFEKERLHVAFRQSGTMPMPLDVVIRDSQGQITRIVIPLDIMRGGKRRDRLFSLDYIAPEWPWTSEKYVLQLSGMWPAGPITVAIDPSRRLADTDTSGNTLTWVKPDADGPSENDASGSRPGSGG